jgi:rubrerythrin
MSDRSKTLVLSRPEELWQPSTRRGFLRLLGVGGTVVLLPSMFAACGDDNGTGIGSIGGGATLDLSTDTGILNYAYALEQLEAGFYTKAVASSAFSSLTAEGQELLLDVRNHEVIHRELFRRLLGTGRIGDLALDTSAVATATASATAILTTSRALEDTGVAAYNGAGKYLKSSDFLTLAGKIVSVEARHAAAFRDILDTTGSDFAGDAVVTFDTGLDVKGEPSEILAAVAATNLVATNVAIGNPPRTLAATSSRLPS